MNAHAYACLHACMYVACTDVYITLVRGLGLPVQYGFLLMPCTTICPCASHVCLCLLSFVARVCVCCFWWQYCFGGFIAAAVCLATTAVGALQVYAAHGALMLLGRASCCGLREGCSSRGCVCAYGRDICEGGAGKENKTRDRDTSTHAGVWRTTSGTNS